MPETITISKDIFEGMIKKKEELDAIIESIELINDPNVQESIGKSKEDINAGRVHKLRDIMKNGL